MNFPVPQKVIFLSLLNSQIDLTNIHFFVFQRVVKYNPHDYMKMGNKYVNRTGSDAL